MATTLAPRPGIGISPAWTFPDAAAWMLSNGVRGHHVEMTARGFIDVAAYVHAPISAEPRPIEGVTSVMARTLSSSTDRRDADEFAAALDGVGATLYPQVLPGGFALRLRAPVSEAITAIDLLAEAIRSVRLPDVEVRRHVALLLDEITDDDSRPDARAGRELRTACFDAHARSSRPTQGRPDTVASIVRDDVATHAARMVGPRRLRVLSAGGMAASEVEAAMSSALADWRNDVAPISPAGPAAARPASTVLVDRPGSVQSQIVLGAASVDRSDPRWAGVRVAAEVLGGSVTSRLSMALREEKGYTYDVHVILQPELRGGIFAIVSPVDAAFTAAAVAEARRIVDEFRATGMGDDEHRDAVTSLVGEAPIRFQAPASIVDHLLEQEAEQLPAGWFDEEMRSIQATTPASSTADFVDVLPDRLTTIVLGDACTVAPQLEAHGIGIDREVEA